MQETMLCSVLQYPKTFAGLVRIHFIREKIFYVVFDKAAAREKSIPLMVKITHFHF